MSNRIYGDIKGISHTQRRLLERLYRRKIPPDRLVTQEFARHLASVSSETGREIGATINRKGEVCHVILGDAGGILIPDLSRFRRGIGRLRGLRCIHTHLVAGRGLDDEDLSDLALLRLDAMVAIELEDSLPGKVHVAHLLPPNPEGRQWEVLEFRHPSLVDIPFREFVLELEAEIQRAHGGLEMDGVEERAILVHASKAPRDEAERSLEELEELARSSNVQVVDKVHQRISRYNPAYLLGSGKLRFILMKGLYLGATMVIFDQDLSPVQVNNIARIMDLKVIDRTQLILDIFARRAQSKEGKIQVELAQLRYLLPRLVGRGTAMSRLTGGIGGRGPGETKLEVDRRRVKQRISSLERELKALARRRRERRKRRGRSGVPVVSIIGYTNAGKSTLLNRLTGSEVMAEHRLFATLDPTTRVRTLPGGTRALFSDTVGFIRRMPQDIKVAFRATLEELEDAGLFLHVVDASSPYKGEEMEAVEKILHELSLEHVPRLVVFNKMDLVPGDAVLPRARHHVEISAVTGQGMDELMEMTGELLRKRLQDTASTALPGARHTGGTPPPPSALHLRQARGLRNPGQPLSKRRVAPK